MTMTANPDSALRQALVAAEKATAPFTKLAETARGGLDLLGDDGLPLWEDECCARMVLEHRDLTCGDLRRAREAHALITEALQRGEKT